MKILSTREVSDLIFNILETLQYEVLLNKPITESKFPCVELKNPLKSTLKTKDGSTIYSYFQISIVCWNNSQKECMEMADNIDINLQNNNLVLIDTKLYEYDDILKKYEITITYEVRYNALTDSFECIR